jgi:hypothetical protein
MHWRGNFLSQSFYAHIVMVWDIVQRENQSLVGKRDASGLWRMDYC